jgi:hypothetical protein
MKLTRAILAEKYKIHNPHNLATATHTQIVVAYVPADTGRGGQAAHWTVYSPYFETDPNAAWYNHGCKTFMVWGRHDKEAMRLEALSWATAQYGITEWERSPFGSYHQKGTLARLGAK